MLIPGIGDYLVKNVLLNFEGLNEHCLRQTSSPLRQRIGVLIVQHGNSLYITHHISIYCLQSQFLLKCIKHMSLLVRILACLSISHCQNFNSSLFKGLWLVKVKCEHFCNAHQNVKVAISTSNLAQTTMNFITNLPHQLSRRDSTNEAAFPIIILLAFGKKFFKLVCIRNTRKLMKFVVDRNCHRHPDLSSILKHNNLSDFSLHFQQFHSFASSTTTPFMVLSITYYSELHTAITFYC